MHKIVKNFYVKKMFNAKRKITRLNSTKLFTINNDMDINILFR